MMALLRTGAFAAALVALCTGAWAQGFHPGNAVRINGFEVSNQRFDAFYKAYQGTKGVAVGARGDQLPLLTQLRREALDLMIEQVVVQQAAQAKGIEVSEQDLDEAMNKIREIFKTPERFVNDIKSEGFTEAQYREHVRGMISAKRYLDEIRQSVAQVSNEELEAYYRDNEYRLTLPEQVRVRHILLTWKPLGQPDDRAALREQMLPILQQARSGADFADLARQHSEDSTAKDGGDTGLFYRGQMVQPFEEAAFALKPGEVSDIVETPYGLHIIRLEEHQAARLLPLDEIREQLREHIREEKMELAVAEEKARLRESADIEILIPLSRGEDKRANK